MEGLEAGQDQAQMHNIAPASMPRACGKGLISCCSDAEAEQLHSNRPTLEG